LFVCAPVYNHTQFAYNMSMVVKKEMRLQKIRQILQSQRGILRTSDLDKRSIPRMYLAVLEQNGEIEKITRGIYVSAAIFEDEKYTFQLRYKSSIYSHETALFIHGLTDRSPLYYSVSVPVGYHSVPLNKSRHKIFYVSRNLFDLGCVFMKSEYGNEIKTTNLERTICDVLRSRNQIETAIVNEAIKKYVRHKGRDLNQLYAYARQFRVQKIVRNTIEVLL